MRRRGPGRPTIGERPMTGAERQRRRRQRQAQEGSAMPEATPLRVPPPLPVTREALLAQRKVKTKRNINDIVEDIVIKLIENETFRNLLDAVHNPQAVHGATIVDDVKAAEMIVEIAKDNEIVDITSEKLYTVVLAMRVAQRRLAIGRPERYAQAEAPAI